VRAEERRAALKRPADLTVWDLILRATAAKARSGGGYGTPEDNRECAEYLRRALELDPQSSQAMALLAQTLWHDALNGWAEDRDRNLEEVLELTRRAVAIDDGNWLAYTVMGLAHAFALHMPDRAVEILERAVALNPSGGLALHSLGCALEFAGRPADGIPHLNAVFRVDPRYRSGMAALADLGHCNMMLGNMKEALDYMRRALAQQPEYLRGRQRLVACLELAGEHEAAREELQSLLKDQPGFNAEYVRATYPFSRQEDLETFLGALKAAGLPE
jgi:tetratricopeptide (TPR) repeat protein